MLHSLVFFALGLVVASSGLAHAQNDPAKAGTPPPPAPVRYTLSSGKGSIYVQVFKDPDTLAAGLSHDHVVQATTWSGFVEWDPASPATCKVELSLPTSGLDADPPALRQRVGYDVMLDDDQRADVEKNMLAPHQLDAAKYPTIAFKATKCEGSGPTVKVTGAFTLRGVTRTITVPMTVSTDGTTLTAKGSFKANHTDFGFEPYTALLGQLKNKNEMVFTIDVQATK